MVPDAQDEKLIFGRYTREECGLPPDGIGRGRPGRKAVLLRAAVLAVLLVAAGWLAGTIAARWREAWMDSLPARVAMADPGDGSDLLARGGLYAAALPDRPRVARDWAVALLVAAERSPRRIGYYVNLANIFDRVGRTGPGEPADEFALGLAASGVYAELGDYAKAFASLERADAALEELPDEAQRRSHRLLLVNAQAYYLASAPAGRGRNPEKALHLAELMITSRDELASGGHASGSAALMDTLATARFAVGDAARALAAQTLALGLADSEGLEVYLKHYDEFAAAAK